MSCAGRIRQHSLLQRETNSIELTVPRDKPDIKAVGMLSDLEIKTHGATHDLTDGWNISGYPYPRKTFYRWYRYSTQTWTCNSWNLGEMPCPSSKCLFQYGIFHCQSSISVFFREVRISQLAFCRWRFFWYL